MHHGVYRVGTQELEDRFAIADPAHHERCVNDRLAKTARQVIQYHDPLSAGAQLQHYVAANVAGAAGD